MKKAVAFGFIIILIIVITACCHAEMNCSGIWYSFKYVKNGEEYDPAAYELNRVVALYSSGNKALILQGSGNSLEGTWAESENSVTILANYKSNIFLLEDGLLTQTVDGGTLWFAKETDIDIPNDIRENTEEAYYGIWELNKVSTNGLIINMRMFDLLGQNITGRIEISENKAYFEIDNGKKPVTWNGEPRYASGKVYFGGAEITMTDTEELYMSSGTERYYFKKDKQEEKIEGWICPSCGNSASGNFCNNCGYAFQATEKDVAGQTGDEKTKDLYLGEYVVGTDIQPGIYILAAKELEYDWMWETNKASIRVLDYIETERDWVKNDYESVAKKGQKIKITLNIGQKLKVESGSFSVASFQEIVDGESVEDKQQSPVGKELYLGEYIVGTDLQPGAYTLSATELEYDVLWEVNKAAIRTYEYIKADRDWVKKNYESVSKKGQKIRITVEMDEKLKVEAGAFEIVDFEYRAPTKKAEAEEETTLENEPWFETGVGSKLPKPIAVSGKVLKASSLVTTNGDNSFYTTVSASKKDYKKYINILREWGFTIDADEVDTAFASTFDAKNDEGYKVSLAYTSFVGMTISAYAPD